VLTFGDPGPRCVRGLAPLAIPAPAGGAAAVSLVPAGRGPAGVAAQPPAAALLLDLEFAARPPRRHPHHGGGRFVQGARY